MLEKNISIQSQVKRCKISVFLFIKYVAKNGQKKVKNNFYSQKF